jgi:hypothetical protein
MAMKAKKVTAKRGGVAVKRAQVEAKKLAKKGPKRSARSDAGRRHGRRTTLRVPDRLESEISRTASELGVSENEALVRLAEIGARAAERERAIRRVIGKRRAAVSGSEAETPGLGSLPSPQEMQEAILVDRD